MATDIRIYRAGLKFEIISDPRLDAVMDFFHSFFAFSF